MCFSVLFCSVPFFSSFVVCCSFGIFFKSVFGFAFLVSLRPFWPYYAFHREHVSIFLGFDIGKSKMMCLKNVIRNECKWLKLVPKAISDSFLKTSCFLVSFGLCRKSLSRWVERCFFFFLLGFHVVHTSALRLLLDCASPCGGCGGTQYIQCFYWLRFICRGLTRPLLNDSILVARRESTLLWWFLVLTTRVFWWWWF